MDRPSVSKAIWRALDERLGFSALTYDVPRHANTLPYSLGGLSLIGFLILIGTGLVMAQFYNPFPDQAHESIRYLMTKVWAGKYIRSLHYWTAQVVFVLVILHLIRVYVTASYKAPREATWLIGVALLAITGGFYFTGTILKWDQEGYEALVHTSEVAEGLGRLGHLFMGDFTRSVPINVRLYIAHVSFFLLALILLLIGHFFLIKRLKISPLPEQGAVRGTTSNGLATFSEHLKKLTLYGGVLFTFVFLIAWIFPAGLGPAPIEQETGVRPPWVFLWIYGIENFLGKKAIFYSIGIFFGLLVLVPFVDRSEKRHPAQRRVMMVLGGLALLLVVILSIYALLATPEVHEL